MPIIFAAIQLLKPLSSFRYTHLALVNKPSRIQLTSATGRQCAMPILSFGDQALDADNQESASCNKQESASSGTVSCDLLTLQKYLALVVILEVTSERCGEIRDSNK